MNSGFEKEKNLEDMSASEIVTEVRKLKEKLEQMLLEQNLSAGSAGVEIDDLTAAHSETNVKLERLGKLEEKEHSIKETEEKLKKAEEAITKHKVELNSVKQSIGADIEELKEQDKIIKEAEYQKNYAEDEYNKAIEDEKELEENYEKFQESSIDDSFVDEEDAHYTKERVEQGEEDHVRLNENQHDYIDEGLEIAAEEEAREAEEAALARGATLEEQHDAYETAKDDFYSRYSFGGEDRNISFHTYVKSDLEDGEERINAAEELKDKAKDDITKRRAKITELENKHEEISSNLNQAQIEYRSARAIAVNMRREREKLRYDIINNLKPLVKKINTLYGNFAEIWTWQEKSNKVKNELEELKKELSNTEDQTDEHRKLLRHGIIKKTILKISMIDSTLHDLTIKHNEILETLGEKDDRSTVDLDLEEYVNEFVSLPWYEERKKVRPFFIQHFNIDETKLVTDFEKQRLDLEVDLAILHQQKKLLNRILVEQENTILRQESLPVEFNIKHPLFLQAKEVEPERLRYITSADTPTFNEIQPDSVLVEEFSWISTLEREFRKLIAVIFKNINNWWTELVPDNVRYNARKHNGRNEEFVKWDETQNFKLLDKLNFNAVTQIFTGNNCWKYFSPVFPKPADYQQNWLTSIKTRLIDTGYCRTRVDHSHRLDDMSHEMLKANYNFFIKCMTDFKNRDV